MHFARNTVGSLSHIDEARQLANLSMVNSKPGITRAGRWEIAKWPAVSKVHMTMEVRLDFKKEAMFRNRKCGQSA